MILNLLETGSNIKLNSVIKFFISIYFSFDEFVIILNHREALVTTWDSRIRYISLNSSSQIYKYKGHKNKSLSIRAWFSDDLELIMSASENDSVYVWRNLEMDDINSTSTPKSTTKSNAYEVFSTKTKELVSSSTNKTKTKIRSKPSWAVFVPLELVSNWNLKLINIGIENRTLKNIILTATLDGRMKVFHSEIDL